MSDHPENDSPVSDPPVLFELSGGVATITLNRPESRNSLSAALLNGLGDALARAATEPGCRVVVLTNVGPAFCAGADLKPSGRGEALRWPLDQLLGAMLDHEKPIVGRIAGHCMGGGVGLAAACDLSIAASDVLFGFTEVRIGVAPAIISVVCLPKMRVADAMELFLGGERVPAERAAAAGLINAVARREELDEEVAQVCRRLALGSSAALAAAKRLVRQVPSLERSAAFEWTAALSAELFSSADAREGMAAFRERRPPSWAPGL